MLMQHVSVGYFGYYRATIYVMKHSVMPGIAKYRDVNSTIWPVRSLHHRKNDRGDTR